LLTPISSGATEISGAIQQEVQLSSMSQTSFNSSSAPRTSATFGLVATFIISVCLIGTSQAHAEKMTVQFKNDYGKPVQLYLIDGNDATVGSKIFDGKIIKKDETVKVEIVVDPLVKTKKEGFVKIDAYDADPKMKNCNWKKTYDHVPPDRTYSITIPGCDGKKK
jgi:hypothetical protein